MRLYLIVDVNVDRKTGPGRAIDEVRNELVDELDRLALEVRGTVYACDVAAAERSITEARAAARAYDRAGR